jgi:hypothetical protein
MERAISGKSGWDGALSGRAGRARTSARTGQTARATLRRDVGFMLKEYVDGPRAGWPWGSILLV